jgi:hypothetical protein
LRAIDLRLWVRAKSRKVHLDAVAFHIFDADAIDAGASSVGSHFFPGPPQYVGPDETMRSYRAWNRRLRLLLAARYSLRWRSRDFSRGCGWL